MEKWNLLGDEPEVENATHWFHLSITEIPPIHFLILRVFLQMQPNVLYTNRALWEIP